MAHLRITISCPDEALKDILIARLSEMGYDAFEEDEIAGSAGLRTFDDSARRAAGDPGGPVLHAYIAENLFDHAATFALFQPLDLAFTRELIPDRNWNEEWERNFEPVVVGDFAAVRASFHPPVPHVIHELVITPKMSFGTGHHATTYMMIEAMQHLDFRGRSVLDFGTGTGVLAILAERLGAADVLAIDHDDWSIENAGENIRENTCRRITLKKMSSIPHNKLYSIILANINKNVILQEIRVMGQQVGEDGVILLSGLLLDDEKDIADAAARNKLTISYNSRMTKGNWICLKLTSNKK